MRPFLLSKTKIFIYFQYFNFFFNFSFSHSPFPSLLFLPYILFLFAPFISYLLISMHQTVLFQMSVGGKRALDPDVIKITMVMP